MAIQHKRQQMESHNRELNLKYLESEFTIENCELVSMYANDFQKACEKTVHL